MVIASLFVVYICLFVFIAFDLMEIIVTIFLCAAFSKASLIFYLFGFQVVLVANAAFRGVGTRFAG